MKRILIAALFVLAAILLTVASPSQAVAAGPVYYIVQPGQTLSGIAATYGVSTWSLARANGIWNWNYVYVGQVLTIPYGGYYPYSNYGGHYPYSNYGGYYPYSNYYANYYYTPTYPYYPRATYGCYYWVRYGDTMSGIAARYGADPWTFARANGIYSLNWIYAGQQLRIPGCN